MKNCRSDEQVGGNTLPQSPNGYRIAPSPTGYVHIGTVGMALINQYLARQNHGRFYLRIEDTDQKRYVPDAVDKMQQTFAYFGFQFDETYVQSERVAIYQKYANELVQQGKAYYCFCTEQDLADIRAQQTAKNEKTGYYGPYARCKHLSPAEVQQRIARGDPYVIRANFGARDWGERITFHDAAKGEIALPPEINDPVIIKSNGLPPYNFAHVIDDTLMGTALVVRGEEWLISTAEHLQLCDLLGFPRLHYLHMPTINLLEDGKKRKLSKRKDPWALVMNLVDAGYPRDALLEYLLTIYNSDFELWRTANPTAPLSAFTFKINKIGSNNPLFDVPKLNDIAKNVYARMDYPTILAAWNGWHWADLPGMNATVKHRIDQMLAVERGGVRPRKDLSHFGAIPTLYSYLFDQITVDSSTLDRDFCHRYAEIYDAADDQPTWWAKIQALAPDKPSLRKMAADLRLAITGQTSTPDLWSIARILGNEVVRARLRAV